MLFNSYNQALKPFSAHSLVRNSVQFMLVLTLLILFHSIYVLQKFLFYVLKSSDVLDILVPILYHLNDARSDQCKYCYSTPSLDGVFIVS